MTDDQTNGVKENNKLEGKNICGIVMPISSLDGCGEGHWSDVLSIIVEAIEAAGFDGNLVSNADDVGIIQKRIIQNLYENPIVVCDVSGKNPNVMFELGMRLAFDKPTIIIKDDKTSYSFDTSPIEHLEYPRDLRFSRIVDFKNRLTEKIIATYKKSTIDKNYTTFLKHFGEFKVAVIDKKEVSGQEFIIDELKGIRNAVRQLQRAQASKEERNSEPEISDMKSSLDYCVGNASSNLLRKIIDVICNIPGILDCSLIVRGDGHRHLKIRFNDFENLGEVVRLLKFHGVNEMPNCTSAEKLHGL